MEAEYKHKKKNDSRAKGKKTEIITDQIYAT